MLSWIKRLLQIFSDSDEQITEKSDQAADGYTTQRGYQQDRVKDLEAKVMYQYPKGQFKFPLIPDQRGDIPARRVQPRRVHPAKSHSRFDTGGDKMKAVEENREAQAFSGSPPVRENLKRPTIQPNRQPFRPTETPSPIYAFQRPKVDSKIEYELKGFEAIRDHEFESLQQDRAYGSRHSADNGTTNIDTNTEAGKESGNEVQKRENGHQASLHDESLSVENKMDRNMAEPAGELSVKENDSQTAAKPIRVSKDDERPDMSDLFIEDKIDVYSGTVLPMEKMSSSEENQPEAEMDVIQTESVPADETEQQGLEQVSKEAALSVPEPAEKEAAGSERDGGREGRRHLPFNVLMLKQDKKKLQEKERMSVPALKTERNDKNFSDDDTIAALESNAVKEESLPYKFPPLSLLDPPVLTETNEEWLGYQEQLLNETLHNFNVGAKVVRVTQGPAVTRFEVQPEPGVKVNKITNLSDDIKLSLAARDIRIEAPIPGKHTIGIEVPNAVSRPVLLSEIVQTEEFSRTPSPMAVALGLDIAGTPVVTDLKKMPHGLIAGATGSGKSVCINTILVSLLYKATPDEVRLLLIDPKMVELAPYNQIPHLVSPVITDVKAATAALKWAVEEMERRYELFAHAGVRDISRFNELAAEHGRLHDHLPYIVIIIDELADLMMMSPADVEEAICRIAQKARACGIHLLIATQRPSVDVITGLIKANVPTRIAFSVSSQVDSRTIIDLSGAEKLLGRGDMLFLENGSSKPFRLQGTYVSDREIDDAVAFVRRQRKPEYLFEQEDLIKKAQISETEDELFLEACYYIVEQGTASTSALQRRFKVGYSRASRLIMMMEEQGFITEARGSKPRDVLVTVEDLKALQEPNLF